MIYRDLNDLVNAWFLMLDGYKKSYGEEEYLNKAKAYREVEGTLAHHIKSLCEVHAQAEKDAIQLGYVGVGIITYAQNALVAAQTTMDKE